MSSYYGPGDRPPVRGDDEFLDRREEQFLHRYLSHPESFPDVFWQALVQKLAVYGEPIPYSQINGPRAGYWRPYTPVWTATSANPTTGDATITGRYAVIGQTVFTTIQFTYGSTSASGTGTWEFSLPPVPAANTFARGSAQLSDAGTNDYAGIVCLTSTTKLVIMTTVSPATFVNATVPFTWGATDVLRVSLAYEASR